MNKWLKDTIRVGLVVTAVQLTFMVAFFFISGTTAKYLFGAALTTGVATLLALGVWAAIQALD